jgi:hypothetical protein
MGAIWRQVLRRVGGAGLLVVVSAAVACSGSSPDQETRAANGQACAADAGCISTHCSHGICCSAGDCCTAPADCPSSYGEASTCTDPGAATTCQGTRREATCTANACGTVEVADDSGCGGKVRDCGRYAAVACTAAADQPVAACAASCDGPASCSPGSACVDGACVAKLADGETCSASDVCLSGHCQNAICCSGASCCRAPADCSDAFRQASACTIRSGATDCQGTRRDATCTSFVCGTAEVADDTGCAGLARDCGLYAAVACTGAADQPAPVCRTSCTGDADCSAGTACISVPPDRVCASSLPGLVWDAGAWNNANWQ